MDGWMDGWRRPNHMRSLIGRQKALRPVTFRRGPRGFHSVVKQASFSVAFRSDFRGLGEHFGRFWDAKMDAKINFLEVFFDVFFDRVLASILGRFFHVFLRADLQNSCAHAVFC